MMYTIFISNTINNLAISGLEHALKKLYKCKLWKYNIRDGNKYLLRKLVGNVLKKNEFFLFV